MSDIKDDPDSTEPTVSSDLDFNILFDETAAANFFRRLNEPRKNKATTGLDFNIFMEPKHDVTATPSRSNETVTNENYLPTITQEAIKIARAFPTKNSITFLPYLTKYSHLDSRDRITSALRDYFSESVAEVSHAELQAEAEIVNAIFPKFTTRKLYHRLIDLGSEPNRVRILLKEIIAHNDKKYKSSFGRAYGDEHSNQVEDATGPQGNDHYTYLASYRDHQKRKWTEDTARNGVKVQKMEDDDLLVRVKQERTENGLFDFNRTRDKPSTSMEMSGSRQKYSYGLDPNSEEFVPRYLKMFNAPPPPDKSRSYLVLHFKRQYSNLTSEEIADVCQKYTFDLNLPTSSNNEKLISSELLEISNNKFDYDDGLGEVMFPETDRVSSSKKMTRRKKRLTEKRKEEIVLCDDSEDECNSSTMESGPNKLYYKVLELFPDAEPQFLQNLCDRREYNEMQLNAILEKMFENPDYPRRVQQDEEPEEAVDPDTQIEILKQVLPDADPNYLLKELTRITTQDELKIFISNALETKNYPTYKDYLRKQQINAQAKQYRWEFSVENFVKLFPNPKEYFYSSERKAVKTERLSNNYFYILSFLKNRYSHVSVKQIKSVFDKSLNVLQTCEILDKCSTGLIKSKRHAVFVMDDIADIPLLQVLAYINHSKEILEHIENKKLEAEKHRANVKKLGLMLTCSCCYDDEVIPEDAVYCQNRCVFCKSCLEKSIEISYGEGKLNYFCLSDCGAELNLQIIQNAINPKLFSKIAQKKQVEEVKAAGIEELEFCPFCDFATIPAPDDKLFRCLNPECMKESCRSCKEPSHVPLRCEEVERDSDVKRRTYVEDKMTEALLRKCWKCGLKFIKADGCNKITCSCGAMMCYICNKAVKDYKHFNGQGGDRFDLCPLYSDTNLFHKEQVMQGAAAAKAELGDQELKIDPTADIRQHYDQEIKRNPSAVPPGVVLDNAAVLVAAGFARL